MNALRHLASATLCLASSISPLAAATHHVATSGDDANSGSTWPSAFRSLQHALSVATAGDEIWISAGTYYPNDPDPANLVRTQAFALKNGVAVYGGFAGTESSLAERDPSTDPVILSGDLNRDDADSNGDGLADANISENAYHVFYHPSGLALDASASLDSVTITGGHADGSAPNNTGGAVYNSSSSPTFSNSTLSGNLANYGGAIYNVSSSPSLSHCILERNTAVSTISGGGAVYDFSSAPVFTACTFRGNTGAYGGAIECNSSTPTLADCTLSGNTATTSGGAINNSVSSDLTLTNCTFSGNSASYGGALYNFSSATLTNCTLAENSAPSGSAIYNSNGTPTLTNCILWDNPGEPIYGTGPVLSDCIVQGGATGTNIITADPLLLSLGDYGGPTLTMPIAFGSPAINTGHAPVAPVQDQRGTPRDASPDIGACEFDPASTSSQLTSQESTSYYALGFSPQLQLSSEVQILSIDWYYGLPGDTSQPVPGASGTTPTLPPLTGPTSAWARITSPSSSFDSAVFSITTSPSPLHVSTSGDDANEGSTWALALRSVQAAIDTAAYGAEVWIAAGTYFPNDADPENLDRTQSFVLKNHVSVYGGFAGTETALVERDTSGHHVVLSGDLSRNDLDSDGDGFPDSNTGENSYHVFHHPSDLALDTSAFLDAVNIIGGRASGPAPHSNGGAILNDVASPTLRNCTFGGNYATYGGAVYNSSSSPHLTNCTFTANAGRAVYNTSSSPTLTNCTLSGNPSIAVYNSSSTPTLTNCILWNNTGGQISGSGATLSHCVIQGGATGTNIISTNPLLLPLGDYGGPTRTMPAAFGSPAIDSGLLAGAPSQDQRGILRDATPDIGACEHDPNSTQTLTISQENTTQYATGFSPHLLLYGEAEILTIQWYYGTSGDTSLPVPGGNSTSLTIPPLSGNTTVWARITSPSSFFDSIAFAITTNPSPVHVSISGSDSNDGSSWLQALPSLSSALALAQGYGSEVWISAGTYYPNDSNPANLDRYQAFELKNQLTVYGGFAGTETSLAERNVPANPVILSGDLNRDDLDSDGDGLMDTNTAENAYHVFYHPELLALDSSARLDSVIIRGARANGPSERFDRGAGMHNRASSPTVSGCVFTDNFADFSAGAVYNKNSSSPTTLIDCVLTRNTAVTFGGATDDSEAESEFFNCTFSENFTTSEYGGGGALSCWQSVVTLHECTFADNQSAAEGGAINNWYGCTLTLENCSLTDNVATTNGGAIRNYQSDITLRGCTFSNNTCSQNGGAIVSQTYSDISMTHCTLFGNSATTGGGIHCDSSSRPTLTSTSIAGIASSQGSAIYSSAPCILSRCIVAGGTSGTQIYPVRPTISNCVIQGAFRYRGTNLIDADPFLLPLGDYGGPTQTMPPATGSPAIDAAGTSDPGGTDQRGLPRFANGKLDIGAVEIQSPESGLYVNGLWNTDFDADGIQWGLENAWGTDPMAPDSGPPHSLAGPVIDPAGHMSFTFTRNPSAVAGTRWIVSRSTDLQSFSEIYRFDGATEMLEDDVIATSDGNTFTVTDENPPSGQGFYRFEALYEP